jgi:hypothetical protein
MRASMPHAESYETRKEKENMSKSIEIEVKSLSDKAAFLQAASDAFDVYVAEQSADQEAIGNAVNAIFDRYVGARLNVPALEGFVMQELKATPATYSRLSERVKTFLEENRHAEKASGKLLGTQKGKNGGIWRWQDAK